jgi:hypothetical protein
MTASSMLTTRRCVDKFTGKERDRRVAHSELAETVLNLSFLVGVPHPFVVGF